MSVFDQLSSWARFIFGKNESLVAEIYRSAAESLTLPIFKEQAEEVLEATRKAGREIVQSMRISEDTLGEVTRDFVGDKELFRNMGNIFWKSCIAEGVSPKEFNEKEIIPRPDSIETFMAVFSFGLKAFGADDTNAILQFNFSGDVQGTRHFRIENGTVSTFQGPDESPDLTIDSPFDVWMDIMTDKADGQQMFMAQKYKVQGDLSLLMRMGQTLGNKASF